MGFFSWKCKGCGKSILSEYAVNRDEDFGWMTRAVYLGKDGITVVVGEYDGYGRIGSIEIGETNPELWHQECWKLAGQPGHSGPSEYAADQGYFFDGTEYQGAQPSAGTSS